MPRLRRWTDQELMDAIKTSVTLRQVIFKLGLQAWGGTYRTIQRRIKTLGLDTSHMVGASHKGMVISGKRTMEELLVENSPCTNQGSLKLRLLRLGMLSNKCELCGQEPEWKGKKLIMVLDHISGINDDYRIENLRLLCPNCNSQQGTFCRGGKRRIL